MIAERISSWVLFLASVFALGLQVWALVDCLGSRPADFLRTDKRTKPVWLALTAGSAIVGLVFVLGGRGSLFLLLNVVACMVAGVYLTDVRPELKQLRRR